MPIRLVHTERRIWETNHVVHDSTWWRRNEKPSKEHYEKKAKEIRNNRRKEYKARKTEDGDIRV